MLCGHFISGTNLRLNRDLKLINCCLAVKCASVWIVHGLVEFDTETPSGRWEKSRWFCGLLFLPHPVVSFDAIDVVFSNAGRVRCELCLRSGSSSQWQVGYPTMFTILCSPASVPTPDGQCRLYIRLPVCEHQCTRKRSKNLFTVKTTKSLDPSYWDLLLQATLAAHTILETQNLLDLYMAAMRRFSLSSSFKKDEVMFQPQQNSKLLHASSSNNQHCSPSSRWNILVSG